MRNYLINKDDNIKYDCVISEEFFSYFYHFRDGVLHGDKSRAKHSLENLEKYAGAHFSEDLLRLALIGMAESFSDYLKPKEVASLMKDISKPAERAFDRLQELIEICYK